jgi:hypothetical protein
MHYATPTLTRLGSISAMTLSMGPGSRCDNQNNGAYDNGSNGQFGVGEFPTLMSGMLFCDNGM